MPLSSRAALCVMVAAVTNHHERYIRREMPLARAYAYRSFYWLTREPPIAIEAIDANSGSPLDTIIQ